MNDPIRLTGLVAFRLANSDNLAVVDTPDGPAVVRWDEWATRDSGVYVPADSLVDTGRPEFAFLKSKAKADGWAKVRACKIRGQVSVGLLLATDADPETLGVRHYEPPETGPRGVKQPSAEAADGKPACDTYPCKYDVARCRDWPWPAGTDLVVTEKLHGANARYVWDGKEVWCGSRNEWKKPGSMWHNALTRDLEVFLRCHPHWTVYGEVYGQVGGFPYDTNGKPTFRAFDVWCGWTHEWIDQATAFLLLQRMGVPTVPVLLRGPAVSLPILKLLAEGPTTLGGKHVREGVVVRGGSHRRKAIGAGYLLEDV